MDLILQSSSSAQIVLEWQSPEDEGNFGPVCSQYYVPLRELELWFHKEANNYEVTKGKMHLHMLKPLLNLACPLILLINLSQWRRESYQIERKQK